MSNLYSVNDVINTIKERYKLEKDIDIPDGHIKLYLPENRYVKYG